MRELILIQWATQDAVERVARHVAREMRSEGSSISTLEVFATRRTDCFALRPDHRCHAWDFQGLCLALKRAFGGSPDVTLRAWIRLGADSMGGLPRGRMLYIGFDHPLADCLTIVDPKGRSYSYMAYEDEETGEETVQAVADGEAPYVNYPNEMLTLLATINVVKHSLWWHVRSFLRRIDFSCSGVGYALLMLLGVVACIALVIVATIGWCDYAETLTPFTLSEWAYLAIAAAIAGLLMLLRVVKRWWGFFPTVCINMVAMGLLMFAVFSVDRMLASDEDIISHATVEESYVHITRRGNIYTCCVAVSEPEKGYIQYRLGKRSNIYGGDSVMVVFHRGPLGFYHVADLW